MYVCNSVMSVEQKRVYTIYGVSRMPGVSRVPEGMSDGFGF